MELSEHQLKIECAKLVRANLSHDQVMGSVVPTVVNCGQFSLDIKVTNYLVRSILPLEDV